MSKTNHNRAIVAAVMFAMIALAGCALDRETQVRALLERWFALGETDYFESTLECTAAVIDLKGVEIRETIIVVRTIEKGLKVLGDGKAIAFDVPETSPTLVSEAVATADLPKGLGILSSGVSAKNCMTDQVRDRYLNALLLPGSVLFFDPSDNALAVLDRDNAQVFFARGNV